MDEDYKKAALFLDNFLDETIKKMLSQHFKEIIGLAMVEYNKKLHERIKELQSMMEIQSKQPDFKFWLNHKPMDI